MSDERIAILLKSRAWQISAVVLSVLLVAGFHWQSDGLWFQGDAPRHATSGLFWMDLLRAMPRDPMEYALRYYARYPVINPLTYPPLVYIIEGIGFAVFGPSPQVAKCIVLLFALMAGLYTMSWARRWLSPGAGWAGAFLAFLPTIVIWSNSIMLNVPAAAFGIAFLYHGRRWMETMHARQLALTLLFLTAVLLTYFQGAVVVFVLVAWAILRNRHSLRGKGALWIVAGALVAVLPLAAALVIAPVQTSRHLPNLTRLKHLGPWLYYWFRIHRLVSMPIFWLGVAGCVTALTSRRWRAEGTYIVIWISVIVMTFTMLPAKDTRYVMAVAPAFILAVAIGLLALADITRPLRPRMQAVGLTTCFALGVWSQARVHVDQVSGFREIAAYLKTNGPTDAVLYDGEHGGLFGFSVRVQDPQFKRRVALGEKLLYSYGPTTSFEWVQTSNVATTEDVVNLLRRSGCRWVAVELGVDMR
ncbi:MAG: glycosyltransferase family 39 protein, partial [bacterium]